MKMWLCLLLQFSIIVPEALPAGRKGRSNQSAESFDVLHYTLSIRFDLEHKTFTGKTDVRARALSDSRELNLDASNETLTIDSVTAEGTKAAFRHATDRLSIFLPEMIPQGSEFTASIVYHGTSTFAGEYDGGGVYFISPSRLATISEPNFARTWWPCNDRPSDKATATVIIAVPESLTAVSNGTLKSLVRENGIATSTWETNYPTATYLISVAAAVYREFTDSYQSADGREMKIYYYVYPEDEQRARVDFQSTPKMLNFFREKVCDYPFIAEKFGYAEVDGNLTMENQTLCSIQKDFIRGDRSFEITLLHETAHQ